MKIGKYLVRSTHILAKFVVNHTGSVAVYRDIKVYIVQSVHIPVMCVVILSVLRAP
jgi:hypothetical protein